MTETELLERLRAAAELGERARTERWAAIAAALAAGIRRVLIADALGCTRQSLDNYIARRR